MLNQQIVCFHNPDEINGYLSNWYLSEFIAEDTAFQSMEQYMMYRKACLFGDKTSANQIMQTNDVAKIKALGRGVTGYNDIIWNGMRQVIVFGGLLKKFKQNDNLKNMLLQTGNSILAECAVKDRIWGIGLSMNDKDRFDIHKWKGQNLLGFALMEVRDRLK